MSNQLKLNDMWELTHNDVVGIEALTSQFISMPLHCFDSKIVMEILRRFSKENYIMVKCANTCDVQVFIQGQNGKCYLLLFECK
jgi:hypothetical protein